LEDLLDLTDPRNTTLEMSFPAKAKELTANF